MVIINHSIVKVRLTLFIFLLPLKDMGQKRIGRPPKDKDLLMDVPLRIMLTATQKALIEEAARMSGDDVAAWARPILLRAAKAGVRRQA